MHQHDSRAIGDDRISARSQWATNLYETPPHESLKLHMQASTKTWALMARTRPWLILIGCVMFNLVFDVSDELHAADAVVWHGPDREVLLGYARDTWRSVAEMGDASELPADGLRHQIDGTWKPTRKTTPTDIASYLWSILAAERLKIIGKDEAERRLTGCLAAVGRLERAHGFFYDKISPSTGNALRSSPYDGKPIKAIASSVDNGWLAASLMMVGKAYPHLRARTDALLEPMDFGFFYAPYDAADPKHHPGQVRGAYDIDKQTFGGFHRLLNTEQRIFSYVGMIRGQIPAEHYYRIERTLTTGEQAQRQAPAGEVHNYAGIPVFEGHYTYRGMRIVPSWGGSMFEALMITLFVPEERWGPKSWGINHPLYVKAQIEHGLKEAEYGYWGFSPACNPNGGYRTYGVDAIGTDPQGYTSNNNDVPAKAHAPSSHPPFTNGVVTPHASFLALRFAPRAALENLKKLREKFAIYGDRGFMDSVNVSSGEVANIVLILDQGMIMAAIANALESDCMRQAFVDERAERIVKPLMEVEAFTAGPAASDLPGR